ncbi:hypothetical protein D3C77_740560 [compost metagenome]
MNDGVPSEGFDAFIFEEQRPSGIVFDVKAPASDGDRDIRILLDLPSFLPSLFAGKRQATAACDSGSGIVSLELSLI